MASTQTSVERATEPVAVPAQDQSPSTPMENGKSEVESAAQGMQGLGVSGESEFALHRACAEGRLEDVREILSRGTESLESLDPTTGCTPVVLAIRLNHPELVQTLLQAGAIVPPPGVTNDQQMLSILYPQPMYGMPPFMHMQQPQYNPQQHQQHHQQQYQHQIHQQQQQHIPEFYPQHQQQQHHQQPFYPSGSMYPAYSSRQRKESDVGQGQPNLPPVDVAKSIPCRNFPNCKYANNCVFFHPRPNQFLGQPGYGYDAGFQGQSQGQGGQGMGYGQPGGFQQFVPQQTGDGNGQQSFPGQSEPMPTHQEDEQSATEIPGSQDNSAETSEKKEDLSQSQTLQQTQYQNIPPPFVPSQMPMSPPQPSDFGGSPISPSMLGASLPSIPPADQFFAAASPPNGFMGMSSNTQPFIPMPMMNQPMNRRQSFNQFGLPINGSMPKPFGKKSSFSGGPRPFVPGAPRNGPDYGKWKDGMPPPCAFFIQAKCRNGEMCKYPHIDAEGNDCRHPDIIAGNIPPMPSAPRVIRRPGQFGTFDPAFKQQQLAFLQQQRAALQQAQQSPNQPPAQDLSSSQTLVDASENSTALEDSTASLSKVEDPSTPVEKSTSTLPPKPTNLLTPATAPTLVRSASQPGIQRVHANGFNSRSQSPAPSNVSFHGNGHPRRNNSRPGFTPMNGNHVNGNGNAQVNGNGNGHGPRSASVETKPQAQAQARRNQRVPGADEFPALGGMNGVDSKQTSPVARGRTAAEVLSAPAPEKPVVAKPTKEVDEKSDDQSIEMDSDNESDGVVISVKPSTSTSNSTTNNAPVAQNTTTKRPSISFAKMASAISAPTESTPIAVKA